MPKYSHSEKLRIVFDDGRKGFQTTSHYSDGSSELVEIVVTVRADGTPCRDVYGPREYLDAYVYSFSRLSGAAWEAAPGAKAQRK